METLKKFDSPGDCQSTGTVLIETGNKNKTLKNENQNQNAHMDGATNAANAATALLVKQNTSPTTPTATNKLKSQQQQQQQQQQLQHQFRAPQQFVKHKKTTAAASNNNNNNSSSNNTTSNSSNTANTTAASSSLNNNKKNKCWNKRQHRTAKQNNTTTTTITNNNNNNANNSAIANNNNNTTSSNPNSNTAATHALAATTPAISGTENENETKKADLENIQNLKNQVGGHYHHHHNNHTHNQQPPPHHHYQSHNQHHGASSNTLNSIDTRMSAGQGGFPPSCLSAMASEKLGYGHGHGHCKQTQQQLHKKPIPPHRSSGGGGLTGNHHHILCAGSAHNTLGAGGPGAGNAGNVSASNLTCCHISGCPSHNAKDAGSANNSTVSSAASALHICCLRSKFFLPDKRPRKGNFIPPTKFLLGGNISDPLNLSSLQNEVSNASSNNNTPATTPRQSPITTPPKVEVIIPPNIHDPLHLLDPVDSMEYEKQLTSPMKRGLSLQASLALGLRGGQNKSHKHRHRKNRKPKRRRYDSLNSTTSTTTTLDSLDEQTTVLLSSTAVTEKGVSLSIDLENICNKQDANIFASSAGSEDEELTENELHSPQHKAAAAENINKATTASMTTNIINTTAAAAVAATSTTVVNAATPVTATEDNCKIKEADQQPTTTPPLQLPAQLQELQQQLNQEITTVEVTNNITTTTTNNNNSNAAAVNAAAAAVLPDVTVARERACRDLRLDLVSTTTCSGNTSSTSCGSSVVSGGGGGRKRKISESNSQKSKKYFRLDSMDKIVSPVVPQPGAWKRPPRTTATGARKSQRRSTSISETTLTDLSPLEESSKQLVEEIPRDDTPELVKVEIFAETGVLPGSPLSTASVATSTATGEPEPVGELTTQAVDTKNALILAESVKKEIITSNVSHKCLPKFTAEGKQYRYGNYDRYAGLRHLNEFMDIRLQVFLQYPELFKNKDILDIGCNVGHMTISVARKLAPKSILGIDIDKDLIARARRNLSMYVRIPQEMIKKELLDNSELMETTTMSEIKQKKGRRRRKKKKQQTQQLQQQQQQREPQPHNHHHHHGHGHYEHWQQFQHHLLHYHLLHHHHHHHHHHHLYLQQENSNVDASDFFPISFPLTYGGITATNTAPSCAANKVSSSPQNIESQSPASTSTTTRSTPGHPATSSASHKANTTHSTSTHKLNQAKTKNDFPNNVFFRQTNYVLKDESLLANDSQQYDLILCLSLTKWIHLNFGDAGLKSAFKRMFNQLRPGGKLILEAQNWASYKKKKNLTEDIYNNYHNIEFYPNKFHEYLLSSEVGFSHSYTLGIPKHLSKGFSRPIQLYAKGDYTPNHVRWSDAYYPQTPFEAYRGIYATMPPRPAGFQSTYPLISSSRSQNYDTPHYSGGGGTSGPYSCRQTPMHQPSTSQYYNPLESDSYQPSYDMEYLNHMYVFASPLYQTVWSPPTSMRKSSSHTPAFGSVRDAEFEGDGNVMAGGSYHRHVYPPNDDTSSPNANAINAFNSIRDPDTDDSNQQKPHVYATNCENSSSPHPNTNPNDQEAIEESLMLDDDRCDLSEA